MMFFKDFLQWIRETGERYVVLDHDGEPEFVIEPFAPLHPASLNKNESVARQDFSNRDVTGFRQKPAESRRHSGGPATIPPEEDLGGEKLQDEIAGWDAMADTLHERATSPEGERGGEVKNTEKKHDEPTFQFETIDE